MDTASRKSLLGLSSPYKIELSLENGGIEHLVITEELGRGGSCIAYLALNAQHKTRVVKEFFPMSGSRPGCVPTLKRLSDGSFSVDRDHLENIETRKQHFKDGMDKFADYYEWDRGRHSTTEPDIGEAKKIKKTIRGLILPKWKSLKFTGRTKCVVKPVYAIGRMAGDYLLSKAPSRDLYSIACVMKSVCAALKNFHDNGKLYLDCKPSNIYWYTLDDERDIHARLFDFDTVADIEELSSGKWSMPSYSPGWASPEQKKGKVKDISIASDIWSVGATFFWLLTGRELSRDPAADDVGLIQDGTFDWQFEKAYYLNFKQFGAADDIVKIIQSICKNTLTIDRTSRLGSYPSIDKLIEDFDELRELTSESVIKAEAKLNKKIDAVNSRIDDLNMTLGEMSIGFKEKSDEEDELAIIRNHLPFAKDKMGKERLLSKIFVGREWLSEDIENWLDDENEGVLGAIYGGAGLGKSSFCVNWANSDPHVIAGFCLEYDRKSSGRTTSMLQSIAYQLALHLPEYRSRVFERLEQISVSSLSDCEFIDLFIIDPIEHITPTPKTSCIIIDGLDEGCSAEDDSIIAAVRDLSIKLPKWIRLLISSRPDPNIIYAIYPNHTIDIETSMKENMSDIEEYLNCELSESIPDPEKRKIAVSALAKASGGVFLFAEASVQASRVGAFDIEDETNYPTSLDSVFNIWFSRIFPDKIDYKKSWRLPLGAIAAPLEPLPEEELIRLLGVKESDVTDLKKRMGSLLYQNTNEFGQDVLSFPHIYYRNWITSAHAGDFQVSTADAITAMASACHNKVQKDCDRLSEYEARNIFDLLEKANLEKDLDSCWHNEKLAEKFFSLGKTHYNKKQYYQALFYYTNAFEIFKNLYEGSKESEYQKHIANALSNIGGTFIHLYYYNAAVKVLESCCSIRKELLEKTWSQEVCFDLAGDLETLVTIHIANNSFDSAEQRAKEALHRCEDCIGRGDLTEQQTLLIYDLQVHIYISLGDISESKDELGEAYTRYLTGLEIVQKHNALTWYLEVLQHLEYVEEKRGNLDSASRWAHELWKGSNYDDVADSYEKPIVLLKSYWQRGNLNMGSGDFEKADLFYTACEEILQGIDLTSYPDGNGILFSMNVQKGLICLQLGMQGKATSYFMRSLTFLERLPKTKRYENFYKHGIACALEPMAIANSHDDSLPYVQKPIEEEKYAGVHSDINDRISLFENNNITLYEILHGSIFSPEMKTTEETISNNPQFQEPLSKNLSKEELIKSFEAQNNNNVNVLHYVEHIESLECSLAEHDSFELQDELWQASMDLARFYLASNNFKSAADYFNKALTALKKIQEDLEDTELRLRYVSLCEGYGYIAYIQNDLDKTRSDFKKGIVALDNINEELCRQSSEYVRHRSYALMSLGDLAFNQGDFEEAKKHYKESYQLRKTLFEKEETQEHQFLLVEISDKLVLLGQCTGDKGLIFLYDANHNLETKMPIIWDLVKDRLQETP